MTTSTSKEFYRQFGKKIYTKIGKELISVSNADKENRSPNEKSKQKNFHILRKPLTLKKVSHPYHLKGLKGGKNKKTQKHRRSKSKRPKV